MKNPDKNRRIDKLILLIFDMFIIVLSYFVCCTHLRSYFDQPVFQ